jgi:hypothetical protein
MKSVIATFLSLLAISNALELTPETWDDAVAGKTVFIKFLAPCKLVASLLVDLHRMFVA